MRVTALAMLVVLSAGVCRLRAQVIVEPEVVTDSIDVFAGAQEPDRSRGIALFSSLVLPGLGHEYLGRSERALAHFGAEALFVCGMIFSEARSRRMFRDSRAYAWNYARAEGGGSTDEYYWQNIGRYLDSDEYNRVMELNRTPEDKYTGSGQYWRWSDEFFQDEYNGLREDATRLHVASSFFLAAMVLNRVVAFIDIRRATRYKGIQGRASIEFEPRYSPESGGIGIALVGDVTRF
ncbi:MAG: hypothetical protein GF418_16150 [Chitinivibrionales bacterium]|nr:hypothetical protein [Chitinivibrionales bacterium]MBD3397153.1 hypothetical protein [Chitinivibrionales bacterium]